MPGPQFATAGKSARRQITRSKRNAKFMPFAWMIGIVEFHAETFNERIDKQVGQDNRRESNHRYRGYSRLLNCVRSDHPCHRPTTWRHDPTAGGLR